MKIVILCGSPHKKGTSNTLVEEFVKGAKSLQKETEIIDLAHIDINPCLGCEHCGMDGDCIQKDKGNEILNKILESDAVVFVSPVYYYNVSSQLKMMIDRFYAKTLKITNKKLKAAVIMTAWNNDDWTYKALDEYFNTFFNYMDFQDAGKIYAKGCTSVSMIPQKYLDEAYNLGRNI